MKIRIDAIKIGVRARKDMGAIDELAASMKERSQLQPIAVTPDLSLVAGERRIRAAQSLGWEEVEAHIVDSLDTTLSLLLAEKEENTCRKPLSPSEIVEIGGRLEAMEEPKAKERQREGGKAGGEGSGKLPEPSKGDTRDKVASALGVSGKTYEKAKAVVKAAEKEPEKFGKIAERMDKTGKVDGAYKQLVKAQKAEEIKAEPPPLPLGPFRVIVADPPWSYDNRAADLTHRASNPYESLSIEQIKAYRDEKSKQSVADLAHADAVLWLWTTNAHMREAFEVVDAWGFTFKTILTWAKDRMGTGDWLRGQTEHCLMCVRGKPTTTLTNQTTLIQGPLREHSRKPDSFYELVEALCPGSKVELFCREQRPGWATHGNETDRFQGNGKVHEGKDG